MRKYLAISAMAAMLSTAVSPAFAQSALNSASQATSQSQSQSASQSGNVYISEPASRSIRNTGTSTIRSAPAIVAPSMSSGHPCAYAPVSLGLSVIGFGGAVGGQRIDDACLLAQMGYKAPSVSMIAARNPAACRALEANRMIQPGYCGGGYYRSSAQPTYAPAPRQRATRVAMASTPSKATAKAGGNCRMVNPAFGNGRVMRCN
jgi:hypothetical protein